MNFNGKAFVKNTTNRTFISHHGFSHVRDICSNHINNCCLTTGYSKSYVNPIQMNNDKDFEHIVFLNQMTFIPYTIQIMSEQYDLFEPKTFMLTKQKKRHDIQDNFEYNMMPLYISRLQPTNIKYNPKSVIVNDFSQRENTLAFNSSTVNVNSKIEVIIPEKGTNYSDISIVVQKNSFIEIKVPDGVINVINLPESLVYLSGYIKGTFTKSGEFNIKLKYIDGEQIINIMIPYYQRLL